MQIACSLIIVGMCASTSVANVVVFDNNASPNTAYFSDAGQSNQRIYDDFSITDASITGIDQATFTGVYATRNVAVDNFTITIYDQNGPASAANVVTSFSPAISRVQSGTLQLGGSSWDVYEYTANFSEVALNTGTTYWISIVNSTSEGWAWQGDSTQGIIRFSPNNGANVFQTQSAMDFKLSLTTVPEPLAGTCFLITMAFVTGRRRRRL